MEDVSHPFENLGLSGISGAILFLLGGGFKHFLCSSLFGEDEPILTRIFQMGWFNHQLVIFMRFNIQHHAKNGASKILIFFLAWETIKKCPVHFREGYWWFHADSLLGNVGKPTNRSG